jgi:predicted metal-binding protein
MCRVHNEATCLHPKESLSAPESWGIDVYGMLEKMDISIEIPPRKIFTRVGLICIRERIKVNVNKSLANRVNSSNNSRPPLKEVLETINELGGYTLNTEQIDNYLKRETIDYCKTCQKNKNFLCDRSFLPFRFLKDHLTGKTIVTICVKNKKDLGKVLLRYTDYLHRQGYWWALPYGNYPCNSCQSCNSKGCYLTNRKNIKKYGRRELWRCIKYLGIQTKYQDDNIGYIVL